jgi:phage-related protein
MPVTAKELEEAQDLMRKLGYSELRIEQSADVMVVCSRYWKAKIETIIDTIKTAEISNGRQTESYPS